MALALVESKSPSLRGVHILPVPGMLYVTVCSYNQVTDYQEVPKRIILVLHLFIPALIVKKQPYLLADQGQLFLILLFVCWSPAIRVSKCPGGIYTLKFNGTLLCSLARRHFL